MAFPGKPTIFNLTLTLADTEYSYTIPELSFKVMCKARTSVPLKMAYTSGASGTNYITIPSDQTYWDDNITTSVTFYFQCATAGTVVELLTWQGA